MLPRIRRIRAVSGVLSLVAATICLAVVAMRLGSPAQASALTAPTASEVSSALARVGLAPEPLAAVGASASAVSAVVSNASAWLGDNPSALSGADSSYASALADVARLEQLVRAGGGDTQALATARSTLASAGSTRGQSAAALFAAATAGLTEQQRSGLAAIAANADRPGPVSFRTVSRSDDQWMTIRDALANERISAAANEQPDASLQQALSAVRGESAVITAAANLSQYLAAAQSAWTQALNPQQ